jgi:hypothetical protein
MRPNVIAIAGLALLLLVGLALGGYLIMGADSGPTQVTVEVGELPDYQPVEGQPSISPQPAREPGQPSAGQPAETRNDTETRIQPANPLEARDRIRAEGDVFRRTDRFNVVLSGRVSDESGRPIAGANVAVRMHGMGRAESRRVPGIAVAGQAAGEAVSDSMGNFRVEAEIEVFSGTVTVDASVSASAQGFVSLEPVSVQAIRKGEERTGINVVVGNAGGLTGRVTDIFGTPLAGVRVSATQPRERPSPQTQDVEDAQGGLATRLSARNARALPREGGSAETDEFGVWRIAALAPGEWSLTAAHASYVPEVMSSRVEVVAGIEVNAPDIRLRPATSLRLRILTPEGEPYTGHMRGDVTRVGDFPATVTGNSDAEGYVVFRQVPPDARQIVVRVTGMRATGPIAISLVEGQENDGGEARLLPGVTPRDN